MARVAHVATSLPLVLGLLATIPSTLAWTYSATNINLVSPPPLNYEYAVENDTALPNYSYSAWPCTNFPVPPNVQRTPFPVTGGRLTFNTTNTTYGSLADYEYNLSIYVGQISLGDGTYSTASQADGSGANDGYEGVDVEVYRDFRNSVQCSDYSSYTWNMSRVVSSALERSVSTAELVGMNASIGVRLVLFGPKPDGIYPDLRDWNYEEMNQCGYVTFTDADLSHNAAAGPCNGGSNAASFSSSAIVPIATAPSSRSPTTQSSSMGFSPFPTSSPYPTSTLPGSTETPLPAPAASTSSSHTVAIAAGVSASISAAFLALLAVWILRRKSRKHTGTVGPHIMVSGPLEGGDEKNEKGAVGKGKKESEESSADSIHSEPLPVYSETVRHSSDMKGEVGEIIRQ